MYSRIRCDGHNKFRDCLKISVPVVFAVTNDFVTYKQAGTGPSRRHIQGSKIAKRLPSVKYSFTVLENRKFFEKFFFEKITY